MVLTSRDIKASTWEAAVEQYRANAIRVCEVPAPTFEEQQRAEFVAQSFANCGWQVRQDGAGNVIARLAGRDARARYLFSAHLDTVFPAGTDVSVREEKGWLHAPGIGDNSTSVGCLLTLAELLPQLDWTPAADLLFVANTCEEGLGDLRGMRALCQDTILREDVDIEGMVAFDGRLGSLINQGIGSRRLRVAFRTTGGHSWQDFGRPSAVHSLGRVVAAISELTVPEQPHTTYNVGVIEGGTSVNTIAASASFLLDLRSQGAEALLKLEDQVREITGRAAGSDGVEVEIEVVGDRPAARLPSGHPLQQAVESLAKRVGLKLREAVASTDANIPLSLGIPALTVGVYEGSGAHTLEERVKLASLEPGLEFALALVTGLAGSS